MNSFFQIGDFCFRLVCPDRLRLPLNFMQFAVEGGEAEYSYTLRLAEQLPQPQGALIAERADMKVFSAGGLEGRLIGIRGGEFYACYQERSETEAEIVYAGATDRLEIDPIFSSLLALERRLLPRDGLILHCAYVRFRGKALLFSAPSETGKTTQAMLWEQYRGAETVNGDRALLQPAEGQWLARGWPVCGSSGVCRREDDPIGALVMLSQGRENQVERLSPAKAFARLYSQITVNSWDAPSCKRAMDLIEMLTGSVPVFHLRCTIAEEAVQCLENAISDFF